jgi:XTP/dITP diphosphohydrolase
MTQLAAGSRLVVASHNPGKMREIAELLSRFDIEVVGAVDLGLAEPEETGAAFAANAKLKAEAAAKAAGLTALADDSGLCVEALNNAPGINSARWAGPNKDFASAMRRVEKELKEKRLSNARAHFVCALALAVPGERTEIFEGRVNGTLVFPPRGRKGFGYDPIFIADGEKLTFGEMEPAKKHVISHRARAFTKLKASGQLPARAP